MNENNPQIDNGNDLPPEGETEAAEALVVKGHSTAEFSIIRKNEEDHSSVPLWLITFTDVMALMLTFFVLLYAMAKPMEEEWVEVTASLGSHFSKEFSHPYNKGSQDAVSIDKVPQSKALDLGYLEGLITKLIENNEISDVLIFQNADRLIISLPSELLFSSGSADVKLEGKKALFAIAGGLSRIRNRLEIVGHTDPAPVTSNTARYRTNWQLSLARASNVALVLQELGYSRDMTVRGLSSGRYDDIPEDVEREKRYNMARRVDIVLMRDEGYRIGGYGFK